MKAGETPKEWERQPAKNWQNDKGARWTKKNGMQNLAYNMRRLVVLERGTLKVASRPKPSIWPEVNRIAKEITTNQANE